MDEFNRTSGIDVMSDFPTTPEALTTDWLARVTGRAVRGFRAAPLGEGVGVIGLVNRVTLDAPDGPASVIIKFAARSAENRSVAVTYNMYGREVRFYRELAAKVPVRTPRCLAAAHDPASHDFVLVLEDLAHCRVGDQLAGAHIDDAATVVRALAQLHATTWNRPPDGVISHNFPAQRQGIAEGFRIGWPAVLDRFPELISRSARARAPALAERIPDLIRRLTDGDQCLIHADVRLDNVLFDGAEVVLVDWQSVCTCSGEQDLSYFLSQSLTNEVRDAHGDELLRLYHATLEQHGVEHYPLATCRERFRTASVYLLAWAVVIAGTLDMGNARGRALAAALLDRSLRAVESQGGFALLE